MPPNQGGIGPARELSPSCASSSSARLRSATGIAPVSPFPRRSSPVTRPEGPVVTPYQESSAAPVFQFVLSAQASPPVAS